MENESEILRIKKMIFELQSWNIYLGLAIVGIFSGVGTAIGNYIFNEIVRKHLLDKKRK